MELKEFIKNFLPDYEKKAKEHKEMGTIMPARMIMFDEYYFPEALQNFADRICEKQRKSCENVVDKFKDDIDKIGFIYLKNNIYHAAKSEIDEL